MPPAPALPAGLGNFSLLASSVGIGSYYLAGGHLRLPGAEPGFPLPAATRVSAAG
jgi:hypothetical protein